jgi:hypothetical protein
MGPATLRLGHSSRVLEKQVPLYLPVRDPNHSRIDRKAEAIGQTWGRVDLGTLELMEGNAVLNLFASDPRVEVLDITLIKH